MHNRTALIYRGRFAILGCLKAALRSRLASLFPTATMCNEWSDVEPRVQRADGSILFVDPLAVEACAESVAALRNRYPSVVVVVYTTLDPTAMGQIVRLAQAGITDVVLFGFDDKPERILDLVEDASDSGALSLAPLEPMLGQVPLSLRRSIEEMFRQPRRFRSTLDLAAAAGISARAAFRYLKAAGCASPRRLVASARVVRAYQLLADRGRTATDVANRLGYRGIDQLSQHLVELGGCTATHIKKGRAPSDFVAKVLHRVLQQREHWDCATDEALTRAE